MADWHHETTIYVPSLHRILFPGCLRFHHHSLTNVQPALKKRPPGLPKCRHRWSNHLLVGCRSPEDFGACPKKCSLQGWKIWGYLGANDLVTIINMFVIYKIVYDCNMILSHPPTMFSAHHATSFYLWKYGILVAANLRRITQWAMGYPMLKPHLD